MQALGRPVRAALPTAILPPASFFPSGRATVVRSRATSSPSHEACVSGGAAGSSSGHWGKNEAAHAVIATSHHAWQAADESCLDATYI
eukprot:4717415-Alexandrium_andersonii.AAC.1